MARVANAEMAARRRARERRLRMDQGRAERDRRIESAVAQVFLARDERAKALQALAAADENAAAALREVLAEGIDIEAAAELCELPAGDVRRLVRKSGVEKEEDPGAR